MQVLPWAISPAEAGQDYWIPVGVSPATISLSVTAMRTKLGPSDRESAATAQVQPLDSIPMLDLSRQYKRLRPEILAAVERVCASQQYILGPEVEAFEREFADFCGVREAVG